MITPKLLFQRDQVFRRFDEEERRMGSRFEVRCGRNRRSESIRILPWGSLVMLTSER